MVKGGKYSARIVVWPQRLAVATKIFGVWCPEGHLIWGCAKEAGWLQRLRDHGFLWTEVNVWAVWLRVLALSEQNAASHPSLCYSKLSKLLCSSCSLYSGKLKIYLFKSHRFIHSSISVPKEYVLSYFPLFPLLPWLWVLWILCHLYKDSASMRRKQWTSGQLTLAI